MKKIFNNKKSVLVVLILAILMVVLGSSFAIFTFSRIGEKSTTLISGDVAFSFIEGEDLTIENQFPLSDSVGASDENNVYNFRVNMTSSANKMEAIYSVSLVSNNDGINLFTNDQIKYNLVKNNIYVIGSRTSGEKVSSIKGFNEKVSTGEGVVLENQTISKGETDYYKLRIWISDDVEYTSEIDENGKMTGAYNDYTYSLKVKVNGEASINENEKEKIYAFGGYVTDNNENILQDKTFVVYSNTPHYVKSDKDGYIYVEGLEEGNHEIFYMGDKTIEELKTKTKEEIMNESVNQAVVSTSSGRDYIELSNKLKISNFKIGNINNLPMVVLVKGEEQIKKIAVDNKVKFDLGDISSYTNIYSNNGSELSIDNNMLEVSNISKSTSVNLSSSISNTFDSIDETKNYILMLKDDTITDNKNLYVSNNNDVVFDIKNYTVDLKSKWINGSGKLNIIGDKGTLKSSASVISAAEDSDVLVSNVNIISSNNENASAICTRGKLIVSDSYVEGVYGIGCHDSNKSNTTVDNSTIVATTKNSISLNRNYVSNVVVNNSNLICNVGSCLYNVGSGSVIINNSELSGVTGIVNGSNGSVTVNNCNAVTSGGVLTNSSDGTFTVNNGFYERNSGTGTTIYEAGTGIFIINDGKFVNSSTGVVVQNRLTTSDQGGNININGGVFIALHNTAIKNNMGTINVQNQNPIYISSSADTWAPAISNYIGNLYINGSKADKCTSNSSDTTSGICVYGQYLSSDPSTGNGAARNLSNGLLSINGGSYYGAVQAINNSSLGDVYITNAYINSLQSGVLNNSTGKIYLCSSVISAGSKDLWNSKDGVVSYSNNNIFSNNSNIPVFFNSNGSVISNYTGSCLPPSSN